MASSRNIRAGTHDGYEYAVALESSGTEGQDRAAVVHIPGGVVVALADGAGGTANGAQAADAVIAAVHRNPTHDPTMLLSELDDPDRLSLGESTAVIAFLKGSSVSGASVGDSGAWLIETAERVDLTSAQRRKPLLGAGGIPVAFSISVSSGSTLLVASDGLLRYGKTSDIVRLVQHRSLEHAAAALIDLVRLPNGRLQDDVAIILCRRVPVGVT